MPAGVGAASVARMIEVQSLAKRYGSFTAVRELSFVVQPGHVLGKRPGGVLLGGE